MDLETLVQEADPVRKADPVSAESEGAQGLLREIIAGESQSARTDSKPSPEWVGSGQSRGSNDGRRLPSGRGRIRLVAASAAVFLIAGLGLVAVSQSGGGKPHRAGTTMRPIPMSWRLVSSLGPQIHQFSSTRGSPQGSHGLACPTAGVCYLISSTSTALPPNSVYRSTDGGMTWLPLSLPSGVFLDTSLSCLSATSCMVGAEAGWDSGINGSNVAQLLLTTIDGGTSWTSQQVPMPSIKGADMSLDETISSLQGSLYDLHCFSPHSCIAFGTTPTDQPSGGSDGTDPISQTVAMRTNDGGATWSTYVFPWSTTPSGGPGWSNEQRATFSCPTERTCVGLATVLGAPELAPSTRSQGTYGDQQSSLLEFGTSDSGASWSHQWVSGFEGSADSLTCPDESHCYAVAAVGAAGSYGPPGILSTVDGGTSWTVEQPFPPSNPRWDGLSSISCPTTDSCWLAGSEQSSTNPTLPQGAMFATFDGGHTWLPVQLPTGLGSVNRVDCVSERSCLAIGQPPIPNGPVTSTGPIPTYVLTNRTMDR